MSKRPPIEAALKHRVMYESAFSCAICAKKGDHIHHIDKNSKNNIFDNLILLCQMHHDEAHTHRELSLNLTAERLKKLRSSWYETVRNRRVAAASASGQRSNLHELFNIGVAWGYINHSRLLQTAPLGLIDKVDPKLFDRLKRGNIVDHRGIIIKPRRLEIHANHLRNTIYDWHSHSESTALHLFYSELTDQFVKLVQPTHLDETTWTKTFIKQMIPPGSFIFINRAQYFRKIYEDAENAEVSVQTFARKIKIRYHVNTRNMYGTTSITCSFSGHKTCASFLQVKSIEKEEEQLVLHCTPIALGAGFHLKTSELIGRMVEQRINLRE